SYGNVRNAVTRYGSLRPTFWFPDKAWPDENHCNAANCASCTMADNTNCSAGKHYGNGTFP
ncbi:hypothetical protein, partial [Rubripirellula obstinata]|uniref:hypothetical protein n=1 Tax=Rubripirellula obstinata TaxID=406547 RepID=UPI001EE3C1C2